MARVKPKTMQPTTARQRILELVNNPFRTMDLRRGDRFLKLLPSRDEQHLYQKMFPREFFYAFDFERRTPTFAEQGLDLMDGRHLPGVYIEEPFRRRDFMTFFDRYKPAFPFDPPLEFTELQGAKAKWWVKNRLPLTGTERAWIEEHLPQLIEQSRRCPDEGDSPFLH